MFRPIFAFLFFVASFVRADQSVTFTSAKVRFATAEEAGKFLAEEDDYFRAIGPLHRAVLLRSTVPVSIDDLKKHAGTCGRDWTPEEQEKYTRAFTELAPGVDRLKLRLPDEILLVKTNGDEDLGAPYTRRNGIVFPEKETARMKGKMLTFVCAHELFHIISRHNPAAHDSIYGVFGFEPVKDAPKPTRWAEDRITNPDAPESVHALSAVLAGGEKIRAVPYLISPKSVYDEKGGKSLRNYLDVVWLEAPEKPGKEPRKFQEKDFTDFKDRTGGNTGYTIHPEEISADNFAHLVTNSPLVRTPAKLKELESALAKAAK